jgi:hypothetical protein
VTSDPKLVASLLLLFLFLLCGGRLLIDDDALRDDSQLSPKPYSLARVQLWWWTMLILGSWIVAYGLTKSIWELNATCLTMLGLSGVTTSAGRIIDNRDLAAARGVRHQDEKRDDLSGFFTDILSDEHGLSVHRFQLVAFNLLFGTGFVVDVFSKLSGKHFPEFSAQTLSLLGLSSGTYIAMKAMENNSARTPAVAANDKSDELLDPGGSAPAANG